MTAIINAELVLHDHFMPNAVLFIDNGVITGYGEMSKTEIPDGCDIIDAKGLYVAPGFVDIHTHAGGQTEFKDDPIPAAAHYLRHGTTTVLAALYFSMDADRYVQAIDRVTSVMETPLAPNLCGIYMEGPYLNPKFGSDRKNNPWCGPIDKAVYSKLIEHCGKAVKVWALAPEREGIEEFVKDAKAANPDVRFSVAHSEAAPEQIEALMKYGLCIGTHHTNATGDRPRYSETRGVCVDETVNYNKDIYAELICDRLGIHVHPYMLRLVRQIKGNDRIILISDAVVFDGPVPKGYEEATDINFDFIGEIAGSKLTLDVACNNMMKHTGASLVDVFNYASYNPAKALGMTDRGEISVGKRADLVFVDHKVNISRVFLGGKEYK